jgi:hypothetical protein
MKFWRGKYKESPVWIWLQSGLLGEFLQSDFSD